MTSSDSKVAKIQTHFQALAATASSLNTASDELSKVVSTLDKSLKKLNVGLTCWVTFRSRGIEDWEYDDDQIGYAKVNGDWGFALRHIWGDERSDNHDDDGPWLFNDAPREMRIAAADKVLDVIEALDKEAANTTKKVQEKVREVGELASAIEKIANEPKAKSLSERIAAGEQSLKGTKGVSIGDMMRGK
jgi:hypothetical protein